MRPSMSLTALASAGLLSGIALTAVSPVATATTAGQESLTVDKAIVHAGNTLSLQLNHGPESISWISSPAFVRTGDNPVGADEGLARLITDRDGYASATAIIDNVPPGSYVVHTRVGGGCGPTATITVIQ
jgi:hypothetical protein